MRHPGLFITRCMVPLLLMAGCAARPQERKPTPTTYTSTTYTIKEPWAFIHADKEKDPRTKIKLLDSWVAQNSDSSLMPYAYCDYIVAYSSINDFPHVIVYADKLLALGAKIDTNSRLVTLWYRAEAYRVGCSASAFQTPEAYKEARDAAYQGLQTLGEWQKPAATSDEEFRTSKSTFETLFNTVSRLADLGMKGDNITNLCISSNSHDR